MHSEWIKRLFSRKKHGFSLIELSALLLVVALAMSTIVSTKSGKIERESRVKSSSHMTEIVAAMQTYLNNNAHYPCVASRTILPNTATFGKEVLADCVTDTSTPAGTLRYETAASSGVYVREGVVPTRDLLLPDSYMSDEYGNRYTYVVMESLTAEASYDAGTAALIVKDGADADITTNAAYLVISHGKDGKGAYRDGSGALKIACGATTNLDVENCDNDATFRLADYNESTTASLFYDDLTHYESKGTPGDYGGSPSPSPPPPPPDFTGFRLDGAPYHYSGFSVSTGDINGDGLSDVIIGAPAGGYVSVVFGVATGIVAHPANVSTLDGTNGFKLTSSPSNNMGYSVNSGDINNDGYDDVIIGRVDANSSAGYTYVVFGKAGAWAASTDISTLNGTNGFRLDGVTAGEHSGYSVNSGDINNDGYDDVLIVSVNSYSDAGSTYVVFGKAGAWAASTILSTLNGTTGFRFDGRWAGDHANYSVSTGDINNDGYDDLIIGGDGIFSGVGSAYVIFGKAGAWAASALLSTLNGTNGFKIVGSNGYNGFSVSSGDINNDGYDDLIIGAPQTDNGATDTGSTYVVFGKTGAWAASTDVSTLNGTTGFRLDGVSTNDYSGHSVNSGDINNDGFDDLIIGAPWANSYAGYTYVVFGKSGAWAATTSLSTLNGTTGFRLDGVSGGDRNGYSVSMGDVNNDGYDDMIIGAWGAGAYSAYTYGIYGNSGTWSATNNLDTLSIP